MSKEIVLEVMGTGTFTTHPVRYPLHLIVLPLLLMYPSSLDSVTNPWRSESVRADDGSSVEIIFYYTDRKAADNAITDDELTPLVFENGRLAGWGWSFLEQNVDHYDLELRVR